MEDIITLQNKYRSVWTKIKFYKDKPPIKTSKKLENVRFCEAIKEVQKTYSVILDRKSINCIGAMHVFGWDDKKDEIIKNCKKKWNISTETIHSILSKVQVLPEEINCIGLNTGELCDVFVSYLQPETFMHILRTYQHKTGRELDLSVSSIMSICGVVVKAYMENKIHISFGCEDARIYGGVNRDRLAIAIPNSLIDLFL